MTRGRGLLSADGRVFILALDEVTHVFEPAMGQEVRTLSGVQALAVSPDGRLLLGSRGQLRGLWHLASGRLVRPIYVPDSVYSPAAFSTDGRSFAVASGEEAGRIQDRIRLWEVATGAERFSISGFRGWVTALAFTPDGRYLVSGISDTTALVWDLSGQR